MTHSRWWPVLGLCAAISMALAAPLSMPLVAAQSIPPHPIHIHTGTCTELGDVVAPLKDVTAPTEGDLQGAGSAVPVEISQTEVDLSLADILASPHAINVHESADAIENYIACGDIGGRVIDGKLVIGLHEINGSDNSGVAILVSDENNETDVTVYLFEEGTIAGTESGGAAPTAAPVAPTAPAPAPTAEPAAAPAPKEVTIDIKDFSFQPVEIEIAVGDTVTWTNQDPAPHTATGDGNTFQSGRLNTGESFSLTFTEVGTFTYHCEFHPNMTGTIVVTEAGAPTEQGAAPAAPTAQEVAVDIKDFSFQPIEVEIAAGDSVTWTNQDPAPHTVTGDGNALQSGRLNTGDTYSATFTGAGTFSYHCEFHPNMTGTIVVT